jgi:hypothetical protein
VVANVAKQQESRPSLATPVGQGAPEAVVRHVPGSLDFSAQPLGSLWRRANQVVDRSSARTGFV